MGSPSAIGWASAHRASNNGGPRPSARQRMVGRGPPYGVRFNRVGQGPPRDQIGAPGGIVGNGLSFTDFGSARYFPIVAAASARLDPTPPPPAFFARDRKSTRLNSS